MRRFSTEKLLLVSIIGSLALLGVVGAIALRISRDYDAGIGSVVHTRQVRGEIARMQVKIEQLENLGRRYLLTGVEEDLAAMPGLLDDISVRQLRLRELTRENTVQQRHLDELSRLIAARVALLHTRIRLRRESGLEAVAAAVRANNSGGLLEKTRGELEAMDAMEEQLLATRSEQAKREGRQALRLIVGSIALGMALVGLSGWRAFADLRQRQRAEAVLAESEARFRQLAEATPQLMWIFDTVGNVVYLNRHGCEYTGAQTAEFLTVERWGTMVHEADLPAMMAAWENSLKTGADFEAEYRLRRAADGLFQWHLGRAVAMRNEAGMITKWFGTAMNIEAQKRTAEQILALNGELADANRELEAFSYSVSHDLRAPLRHIDGFINLLQKETAGKLSPKGAHYEAIIAESAQSMGRLIDDLLDFARIGRVPLQSHPVALRPLFELVRSEIAGSVPERRIEWRIGELPSVQGDSALLAQVVRNLLENAVKFTNGRDPARIEVSPTDAPPGQVGLVVRDNGAGFDMAYAGKLFTVFQRLHSREQFEGTGIGLATVRRIINRMGGEIRAEAAVDAGADFYITLPAAAGEASHAE